MKREARMSDLQGSLRVDRSGAARTEGRTGMGSQMDRAQQSEAELGATPSAPAGDDEFMTADDLGRVIDDLRSGRRPGAVEDQEP
jgi:hypothetical protein